MASTAKPSRNHHFSRRSTLQRFSINGRGKQVWVCDKTTGERFSLGLGGAGSANGYNTLVLPNGEIVNFEDAFGNLLFAGASGEFPWRAFHIVR